jgi:hypothetical protein
MTRMPRSLQGRLLVLVLGLVVGVWMATAVMTWFDVRHELDELLDSHLAQAAALLIVQQAREMRRRCTVTRPGARSRCSTRAASRCARRTRR